MIHPLAELPRFLNSHCFAIIDSAVPWEPPCPHIRIPGGETCKTRAQKELLEDLLLSHGVHRNSTLIAVGGGALLDLVGFTAATFMRGIPYYSIPTTHLAMVDACWGGKVGINTPHGKNLIGAFHLPQAIFLDTTFLSTLPPHEFQNGTAETFKHALIASAPLFAKLEQGVLPQDLIAESLAIKQHIVQQDPFDRSLRQILNFGHTVGHALELLSHFTLAHGQAVASGCIIEARMSNTADLPRITSLFTRLGFTLQQPSPKDLFAAMQRDKKKGYIHLLQIGKATHPPIPFTLEQVTRALA